MRDAATAGAIQALGITPVLGSLADAALLTRVARTADAVIDAASGDDRLAIEALVAGLAGSGKVIHTSGRGIAGAWGRQRAVVPLGSNSRVRGRRARDQFGRRPVRGLAVRWIAQALTPA